MKITGKRPSGGSKGRAWLHVGVTEAEKVQGWIAGPAVGVSGHCIHASKPCHKLYLGANARCPGCEHPSRVQDFWYQPFYRETDGRPCLVILHEDQADAMSLVKLHEFVEFGREPGERIGIHMQRLLKQREYHTTLQERKVTADPSDFLATLWGLVGVITGDMIRRGPVEEVEGEKPAEFVPNEKKHGPIVRDQKQTADIIATVRKAMKGASPSNIENAIEDALIQASYSHTVHLNNGHRK